MMCPLCHHDDTEVLDSRPKSDGSEIRRRRNCKKCGGRFSTIERPQETIEELSKEMLMAAMDSVIASLVKIKQEIK